MIPLKAMGLRKFVLNTGILVVLIAISGLIYIRIAPNDMIVLHVTPPLIPPASSRDLPDSYEVRRHVDMPPGALLSQLDKIILKTPRTSLLAGASEEGMITYMTRSRVFGFPDYTTVMAVPDGGPDTAPDAGGSDLTIYGHLRYGRSDLGVNKARITGWLKALDAARSGQAAGQVTR